MWAAGVIRRLFMNEEYCDVIFMVDNVRVGGHKNILAARCPYFATMLFGETNEAKQTTIHLKSTPPKPFKELVRYIYLNELDLKDWNIEDVLALLGLSHEYQFDELTSTMILLVSRDHLKTKTMSMVYDASKLYDLVNLTGNCLHYVDLHSTTVLSQLDNFVTFSVDFLRAIVQRDCFRDKQKQLLRAIMKWRSYHTFEETKEILQKLQWELLPREDSGRLIRSLLSTASNFEEWESDKRDTQPSRPTNNLKAGNIVRVYSSCSGELSRPFGKIVADSDGDRLNDFFFLEAEEGVNYVEIFFSNYVKADTIRFSFKQPASATLEAVVVSGEAIPVNSIISSCRCVSVREVKFRLQHLSSVKITYTKPLYINGLKCLVTNC